MQECITVVITAAVKGWKSAVFKHQCQILSSDIKKLHNYTVIFLGVLNDWKSLFYSAAASTVKCQFHHKIIKLTCSLYCFFLTNSSEPKDIQCSVSEAELK